jgi:hypothetical protein
MAVFNHTRCFDHAIKPKKKGFKGFFSKAKCVAAIVAGLDVLNRKMFRKSLIS